MLVYIPSGPNKYMCVVEGDCEKNEGEEQRNVCGGEGACEKNEGGGVMKCVWWRGCM